MNIAPNITLVSKGYHQDLMKYANYNPDFFVGKYVKKKFIEGSKVEYMWVLIKEVNNDNLVGELNNDPFFIDGIKCGGKVKVKLQEILAYTKSE